MAKNGWKLGKVAITGSTRSLLAKNGRKWVLVNQIRPTTLVFGQKGTEGSRFWPLHLKKMPNKWRTIDSSVHKIDFTVNEGEERLNPSSEKN